MVTFKKQIDLKSLLNFHFFFATKIYLEKLFLVSLNELCSIFKTEGGERQQKNFLVFFPLIVFGLISLLFKFNFYVNFGIFFRREI